MRQRMSNRSQKEHYSSWCELPSGEYLCLSGAWPLTALLCCTHPALASPAGLAVPSTEDPGSKELQLKAQYLCCIPSSFPDTLCQRCSWNMSCPKHWRKWGGKYWDLPVCSVSCFGRRLDYCNAPSSFLSSPGSLSKPVELLWSSTSVSLRRIKWSTMRG